METYEIRLQNWSQESYIKAYIFAAHAHQGQKFPGTNIPYIMHLSFVSMEIIAALNAEKEHDGDLAIQSLEQVITITHHP